MNIELYGFAILVVIIIGQYFFQRYTAKERDEAQAALKAAEVLGKNQNAQAIDTDKRTKQIKEDVDAKLKEKLGRIDAGDLNELSDAAALIRVVPGSPEGGECAERLAGAIKQIAILNAKLNAVKEWYQRAR